MKLTKEHIGQKFRLKEWDKNEFFLLLAVTSRDVPIGEDNHQIATMGIKDQDWQPYAEQKQKKRVEAAPAVVEIANAKSNIGHKKVYQITESNFGSKDSAEQWFFHNHVFHFIKWPADFDKEKGVWFYEWEE